MSATCDSLERLALGAYVLGALDPVERTAVEAHLAECAPCRDEIAQLAGLPGLLARVRVEDVLDPLPPPPPPPALAERLIERVRAARRTRRRRLAAAASALTVAAAAAGAVALVTRDVDGDGSQGGVRSVSATSPRTGVEVEMALQPTASGTAVRVRLRGVPAGTRCRLIAYSRTGRREVAGTWRATYEGTAQVQAATAIPKDELASFAVVTARGRQLVRAPLE